MQLLLALGVSALLASMLISLDARGTRSSGSNALARGALSAWGAANILFVVFLWFNHASFPLHLDLMEGAVLQHAERAARLAPVYPEPSANYVPLAYNALYYYVSAPFIAAFGSSLTTLRLVSIAAMLLSACLVFRVAQQRTGSAWWGLMAVSLFAAAYRVMDAYLDTAHSDAWFLCSALAGSYILDVHRSRVWDLIGMLVLVAAFWFKQHGALFALGGLLFLTLRDGRHAWPCWLVAAVAGPAAYLYAGPALFGSRFHYFTWTVPSAWSGFGLSSVRRFVGFILRNYAPLAIAGLGLLLVRARGGLRRLNIWEVQFAFALLSGLMGVLDSEGSDNVFIPLGTWFILMGAMGLHALQVRYASTMVTNTVVASFFVAFGLLAYNPVEVITSTQADDAYADLLQELRSLPGPIYAPSQGQLAGDFQFYPGAHWVALEDMLRGPGRETRNQALTRKLLDPAINPQGSAFILTNRPLPDLIPALAFLDDLYVLERDFGDRFKALRCLPKRWDHGWPRYLYRYDSVKTRQPGAANGIEPARPGPQVP